MRIFASHAQHINQHTYRVKVPSSYNALTEAEIEGDVAPMFDMYPGDVDRLVDARQTIANLIDMTTKRLDFRIVSDRDLIEIMHTVEAYCLEKQELTKRDPKIAAYVKDCFTFRQCMYKAYYRAVHLNPDFLKAFSSANQSGAHSILSIVAGNGSAETDGTAMLSRNPPYELPAEKKMVIQQQQATGLPTSGYSPLLYGR